MFTLYFVALAEWFGLVLTSFFLPVGLMLLICLLDCLHVAPRPPLSWLEKVAADFARPPLIANKY